MVDIILTKTGMESKVLNPDGSEIAGVTKIVVTAQVDELTTAEIDLIFIESTEIMDAVPVFRVGGYSNVTALILADGNRIDLGGLEPGRKIDWQEELRALWDAHDTWQNHPAEFKRNAMQRARALIDFKSRNPQG